MQQICPVCNGMVTLNVPCSDCGKNMEDQGHASDYFGPYSPYEEDMWPRLTGQAAGVSSFKCVHFLQCPLCCKQSSRSVSKIVI